MITTKELELVRFLAETGSLTAASIRLHISQPAASQRLSSLQERLDTSLFQRQNGTLQPTAAGERLLAAAIVVTDELQAAVFDIEELSQRHEDQLRISTQCYTCYRWLPFVIRNMRQDYPLLYVDVVPEATDDIHGAIRTRQLDVGIVSGPVGNPDYSEYELFSDEFFAVMHEDHALAGYPHLDAADFIGQTLVLYTGNRHAVVEEILAPAKVSDYRIIQVRITEAIIELVRAGQGIAVIAGWALDDMDETEMLRAVRITENGFIRNWKAVVREGCNPDYADALVRHVRSTGAVIQDRSWRKRLRAMAP